MDIYLTLDYEIFFGPQHGTVENCIIKPTERILSICESHGVKINFFVDVGFLLAIKRYKKEFPELTSQYGLISKQLKNIAQKGHDLQLHIHPHWEDCIYNKNGWQMNVERYRLNDFSDEDIRRIITEYKTEIEGFASNEVNTYRGGGWCIQPFDRIGKHLSDAGIRSHQG